MEANDRPPSRRRLGMVVAVVAVAVATLFGWRYFHTAALNPLSQDATITANVANISATVPGRIAAFHIADNATVRQGDLLFSLDPVPYRLQMAQAAADLRIAQAAYADRERAVEAARANATIAQEQVTRARQNLALATQTLARIEPLRPRGFVSAQQVDDAATAKRDAEVSLRQALAQQAAAELLVSDAAAAAALVEARRAALALAERALADTEVRAPFDGKVVGLLTAPGEFVISGQALFALVESRVWYVTAAFDETVLPGIAAGNCATVFVLADRRRAIEGRVESIGWGVASEDLIKLPRGLPIVPKTLDWVRVAQRFPVRIRLFSPPDELMRVGASATATVHHGTSC